MDQSPPNEGSSVPVQAHLVPEPFPTPPRRKSRFFVRLLLVFLVLGFFGSLMLNLLLVGVAAMSGIDSENRVQEKFVSHNRNARDKVAILSIEGTILSGEGFFKQQIDHARKDAEDGTLKAIVLRVNSPGGTISGSDYMLHHLQKLAEDTQDSHRGQHGRHRGQRRLLRVDVRRRYARDHLRRADHLDRLDRRDHSALQRRRTDGEMGHSGRRGRQPPPQRTWAASPAR